MTPDSKPSASEPVEAGRLTDDVRGTASRAFVDAGRPAADVRSTRQKRALSAVLAETDRFRSAQELHAALQARGERVGLTTVYQQLRTLAAAGRIDSLRAESGELLYRHCDTARHHHHLVCRVCGRTVEVEDTVVWRWADRVAADAGFVEVDHQLEFSGICPDCAGRRAE